MSTLMTTIIAQLKGEGFTSTIRRMDTVGMGEVVTFMADLDIDADGANGQAGGNAAYRVDGNGSELLENGGMTRRGDRVVFNQPWGKDVVLVDANGNPLVLTDGIIPSMTAYRYPEKAKDDPTAYVDAETIPYIAIPPIIVKRTRGAVLGSACEVLDTLTDTIAPGVVADVGPRTKNGEASIQMARDLKIPASPRSGGISTPRFLYTIHVGVPAVINGHTFRLQRSNGTYV